MLGPVVAAMGKKSPGEKPRPKSVAGSERLSAAQRDEVKSLDQQLDELLASGGADLAKTTGAGLPTGSGVAGRTMMAMQKFRVDWFSLPRKALFEVAAVLAERHWFVRPVVELNMGLYGCGFRFAEHETRKAVKDDERLRAYPFARVARELMREVQTSSNAVALWLRNDGHDELPEIYAPDMKDCEVLNGGTVLKLKFRANRNLSDDSRDRYGEDVWKVMKNGGSVEIKMDDDRWAWRAFTGGKITSPLAAPSLTGILDDLDFIEAIKVGDWSGAVQRRKMILQAAKGYAITSGSNAGVTRGHAKRAQLNKIAEWLRALTGAATMATNFDTDFKHIVFPTSEHFSAELSKLCWERLLMWAGFAGVLLFKSESQIAGVSPYLMLQLRTRVQSFREEWIPFVASIFNDPRFRGGTGGSLDFTPMYGNRHLYSIPELEKLVTINATYATMAPQTLREEVLDLDNDREVERMKKAHGDRDGYIPPYEPRQGVKPTDQQEEEGEPTGTGEGGPEAGPGRPAAI